jgi:DNA-binding response OmpR family regulator
MNATNLIVPRALLLDTDPSALRSALDRRGFEVLSARDGSRGVALLLETLLGLDVLVVDAELPGRDAERFLHLVRGVGGERELAIVVVGDAIDAGRRRALLALGADAVVDRRHGPALVAEAAASAAQLTAERRAEASGTPLDRVLDAVRALAAPPFPCLASAA